ncbi:MAG: T9SS type A sorting domain-containing protein [Candidatus Cloacimonetes bacterium]|nr:T9SS type A sorting domain-containing protein [Candidatus Cloacimonadota bacterium]
MMKQSIVILVVFFSVLLSNAAGIEFCRSFDYPEVSNKAQGMVIEYEDCLLSGAEGEPYLPWQGISLLLPQNECIETITLKSVEYYDKEERGDIAPAGRQFFISQPGPADYQPVPDPEIYEKDAKFPISCLSGYTTGYLCGHSIGSMRICPVEYNPIKQTVRFIKSIELEIKTESVANVMKLMANLRSRKKVEERIERIVENSEALAGYSYREDYRTGDCDLLIITSTVFGENFAEYINYKESTGYMTSLKYVEDIYNEYSGIDEAEQVRNCIIDYYQNNNLEYVLLGGDAGNIYEEAIVPHREMMLYSLPSDVYYSNLDGTFYDEESGDWGNYGDMDMYSEIAVGRWCVDCANEITIMSTKHINYQNEPVINDICKGLMVGEQLDEWTWGGDYKHEIATGGYFNGYETAGFPAYYSITELYESLGGFENVDIFNEFSNLGTHLVNHLGHSNPTYNMKVNNSDLVEENFTNNGITRGLAIGYSQGCYNGSFDNYHFNGYYTEDCFAEKMTGGISGGEVACIANSRSGYYSYGNTDGASQYYDRMFFDGLFGEDITKIGEINSFSHEADVSQLEIFVLREIFYETNLFGDPSLDIWTEEPLVMNVILPESANQGDTEINIETGVEGARAALLSEGELLARGITNIEGDLTLNVPEGIASPYPLQVSVIAHNYQRYTGEIEVLTPSAYVVYQACAIHDETGNNNNAIDFGETISLDLAVINGGDEEAGACSFVLNSLSDAVTLIDYQETSGAIGAGEIEELELAFSFMVSDAAADSQQLEFTLTVSSEGEEWESGFTQEVLAPELVYESFSIDDSIQGNNNGMLDPGEGVELHLQIGNNGHSTAPAGVANLSSYNPNITIDDLDVAFTEIIPNGNTELLFSVIASDGLEIGSEVDFYLNCQAGNYNLEHVFSSTSGLIMEDFESADFSMFNWEFPDDVDWEIDTLAYEGEYSACCGETEQQDASTLSLDCDVMFDSEIVFCCKVSCYRFADYLIFKIDDEEIWQWTGEVPWVEVSFPVTQGHHTFEWSYEKQANDIGGANRVWLDNIRFPALGIPGTAELVFDQEQISITAEQGGTGSANLTLINQGEENLHWEGSKYYLDSRAWGGPDGYGYVWMDSNEYNEIEFDWIDISGTGTAVSFTDNDTSTELLSLGFTFNFYGEDYAEFRINPNGWIGFGEDNTEWSNTSLPNRDAPCPAILPFWDDLYPLIENEGGGVVYYQNFEDHLVVMFDDVMHFSGNYNGTYAFEVIIWADGRIKMQYHDLEGDIDTCTIGLQSSDFQEGLLVVYNDTYLEESLAIEVNKVVDWMNFTPECGEILNYESQNIQISANADSLSIGEYCCNLIIHSNDPEQAEVIIPVILTVIESDIGAGDEIISTSCLNCNYPNPFNPTTTIEYQIAEKGLVHLDIYNIKGQHVTTLVSEIQESGKHSVIWQGRDDKGNQLASGIYLTRLRAGRHSSTRKMILLK